MSLTYDIVEIEKEKCIDIDSLVKDVNKEHLECTGEDPDIFDDEDENEFGSSVDVAVRLDYSTNYTVKMLRHILDYYKIEKNKLRKTDMVDRIIEFENDYNNIEIVEKRKYLWQMIEELKNDEYMSKFVIFDG